MQPVARYSHYIPTHLRQWVTTERTWESDLEKYEDMICEGVAGLRKAMSQGLLEGFCNINLNKEHLQNIEVWGIPGPAETGYFLNYTNAKFHGNSLVVNGPYLARLAIVKFGDLRTLKIWSRIHTIKASDEELSAAALAGKRDMYRYFLSIAKPLLPPVEYARDVEFLEFMFRLDSRTPFELATLMLSIGNWHFAGGVLTERKDPDVAVEILLRLGTLAGWHPSAFAYTESFNSMYDWAIAAGKISFVDCIEKRVPPMAQFRESVEDFERHGCCYQDSIMYGERNIACTVGTLLILTHRSSTDSRKALNIFDTLIASIGLPESKMNVVTITEIFKVLQSRGFLIPLPPCEPEYRDWFQKLGLIV